MSQDDIVTSVSYEAVEEYNGAPIPPHQHSVCFPLSPNPPILLSQLFPIRFRLHEKDFLLSE